MISSRFQKIFLLILFYILYFDACSERNGNFRKERARYRQEVEKTIDRLDLRIAELNTEDSNIGENDIINLEDRISRLDALDDQLNRVTMQLDTVSSEHWNSLRVRLDSLLSQAKKTIKDEEKTDSPADPN